MKSKRTFALFVAVVSALMAMLALTTSIALADSGTTATASEEVDTTTSGVTPNNGGPVWQAPSAAVLLYDNGPLATSFGTGPGGADESVLENNTLGMTTLGAAHQAASGNHIADEFTPTTYWFITQTTTFAYQSFAGIPSTMTAVNYQLLGDNAGAPDPANVLWGDLVTNRMVNTAFSNIYRVAETTPGNADRAIHAQQNSAGYLVDPATTYWLDWQTDGSGASGPWAPPITIPGQSSTGNAFQDFGGAGFAPLVDGGTGTPLGMPFLLEGFVVTPTISLSKTVTTGTTCPGANSITVNGATAVTYCYKVTNTGNITMTVHDLVDDQLGAILTGAALPLGPGAMATFTATTTIMTDTMNTATFTATLPAGTSVFGGDNLAMDITATSTDTAFVDYMEPLAVTLSEGIAVPASSNSLLVIALATALLSVLSFFVYKRQS